MDAFSSTAHKGNGALENMRQTLLRHICGYFKHLFCVHLVIIQNETCNFNLPNLSVRHASSSLGNAREILSKPDSKLTVTESDLSSSDGALRMLFVEDVEPLDWGISMSSAVPS